jgi:GNAT superfamily N-acetyltransferase
LDTSWNSGSWVVRSPKPANLVGLGALVDQAVGHGFLVPHDIDPRFSFLCSGEGRIVGAVIATLASYADLRVFYRGRTPLTGWGVQPEPVTVGHVREVAVLEDLRRAGLAKLLLTRSETAFRERGVEVFVANAWIRRDTQEALGGFLLESCGYRSAGEIPGFFESVGVERGAACPACGRSPCVCGTRAYLKDCRAAIT